MSNLGLIAPTMEYLGYVLGAFALFVLWRWTSVGRGARKRDRILARELTPLLDLVDAGKSVSQQDLEQLAARAELRPMLWHSLEFLESGEMFPEEFTSLERQAEGQLAYWLCHPNEGGRAPACLEVIERFEVDIDGRSATFLVLRYVMPPGDRLFDARGELGIAGPFFAGDAPYSGPAGAFSRLGDYASTTTPKQLFEWYMEMLRKKGQME